MSPLQEGLYLHAQLGNPEGPDKPNKKHIISRIDGKPRTRISPLWPPEKNT